MSNDFEIDLEDDETTALATPAVFETFGPYKIVGIIGQGGMAELALALRETDRGFRQVVVLKRILPNISAAPGFAEMFVEEARLMGRLEHPNIVRVFDFGEVDDTLFLSMEYLAGEDLQRILRRLKQLGTRMPVPLAVSIARDVAAALHYAHHFTDESGKPLHLVHRDVSPSNIVLSYQGVTKLIDFGIAKSVQTQVQTNTGEVKGKLQYIAPEIYLNGTVDEQVDVYALGCVLWELLTGERLFAADVDGALMHAIVQGPVPNLRALAPDVDPQLIHIVERATARDRTQRFATAEQLETALDTYLHYIQQTVTARVAGQWLTDLAGPERASAKQAVAAGTRLSVSIPKVMKVVAPSTASRAVRELVTPPPAARELSPWRGLLSVGALLAFICGVGLMLLARPPAVEVFPVDPSMRVYLDGALVTNQVTTTRGPHLVQWGRGEHLKTAVVTLLEPLALTRLPE